MKRIISCLIIIATLFLVTACQKNTSTDAQSADNDNASSAPVTTEDVSFKFNERQVEEMSNFMNDNRNVFSGTWLYGTSFKENGKGTLTKIKTDGSEQERMSDNFAEYINVVGNWLYFVGYNHSNGNSTISKIRLSGKDEKALATISKDNCKFSYLFVYNDRLYFSENDESNANLPKGKFCQMDFDGKNKKTIINKAVYYPYIINNKIYYQDDNDYCKIHVCDVDGSNDRVFINEWVYQYFFDGRNFYYVTYEDKNLSRDKIINKDNYKRIIKRCDYNGKNNTTLIGFTSAVEMAMNSTTIYYADRNDNNRIYSYSLSDGSVDLISNDTNVSNLTINNNLMSYVDYDSDYNYIDNIFFCSLDGTNKTKIFENDDE